MNRNNNTSRGQGAMLLRIAMALLMISVIYPTVRLLSHTSPDWRVTFVLSSVALMSISASILRRDAD